MYIRKILDFDLVRVINGETFSRGLHNLYGYHLSLHALVFIGTSQGKMLSLNIASSCDMFYIVVTQHKVEPMNYLFTA